MRPTVSHCKVSKPNIRDPLLETGELREDLEKRQQFAVSGGGSSEVQEQDTHSKKIL